MTDSMERNNTTHVMIQTVHQKQQSVWEVTVIIHTNHYKTFQVCFRPTVGHRYGGQGGAPCSTVQATGRGWSMTRCRAVVSDIQLVQQPPDPPTQTEWGGAGSGATQGCFKYGSYTKLQCARHADQRTAYVRILLYITHCAHRSVQTTRTSLTI